MLTLLLLLGALLVLVLVPVLVLLLVVVVLHDHLQRSPWIAIWPRNSTSRLSGGRCP